MGIGRCLTIGATLIVSTISEVGAQTFVNFETPHVNPLALTPAGTRQLAVNTADIR
jgi:hypothetical protein